MLCPAAPERRNASRNFPSTSPAVTSPCPPRLPRAWALGKGSEQECMRIGIYVNPILQGFALSSYSFVIDLWNSAEIELIFL